MFDKKPSLQYVRVREVHEPTRANKGDAGIDFYVPTNLQYSDLSKANQDAKNIILSSSGESSFTNMVSVECNFDHVTCIHMGPHTRVSIPSGIKMIIDPIYSMLQANDKSGVSSKKGLMVTAGIVDSPYVGELHLVVVNTTDYPVLIKAGEKLVQFIHVPIYMTKPEEISDRMFEILSQQKLEKSGRGDSGMGSNKQTL